MGDIPDVFHLIVGSHGGCIEITATPWLAMMPPPQARGKAGEGCEMWKSPTNEVVRDQLLEQSDVEEFTIK